MVTTPLLRCAVLVIAVAGCRESHEAPSRVPAAPSHTAAPSPPTRKIDQSVVHVARLHADGTTDDVVVPEGPDRSGEQVRGLWIAPDGTEIVTGYMYTGAPGPDTGVVYRRRPGERGFEILHMIREHELGHIAGVAANDFYIGGANVLQHFDGTTWTDLELPPGVKDISALALHDGELWVASFDRETVSHRKLDAATWTLEQLPKWHYDLIAFVGDDVFAGGVAKLEHRLPNGTWRLEVTTPYLGIEAMYVASPKDLYIAGGSDPLLHYDGTAWKPIVAPDTYADTVWGRSPNEIYLTMRKKVWVWRGPKQGYSPTALAAGRILAGNATEVVSAYEVDHAHAR